jgi:hypothetical protein
MPSKPEQHDTSSPEGTQPGDEPCHYKYTLKLEFSIQQYQGLERFVQSHYTTIPCLFKGFSKLMLYLLLDFGQIPGAEIILRQPGKPDKSLIFYP